MAHWDLAEGQEGDRVIGQRVVFFCSVLALKFFLLKYYDHFSALLKFDHDK